MTFNINKPSIDRNVAEQVQIAQIVSFLERLTNDLNYHLNHLDQANFNEEAAKTVSNEAVLVSVNEQLEELEKRLTSKMKGV